MNKTITNPIIVHENGDVLVFDSVEKAETYLEPIDVLNGEYTTYDSVGILLKLSVIDKLKKVRIEVYEPIENCHDELMEILRNFFLRVGIEADSINNASLQQLVEKSREFLIE